MPKTCPTLKYNYLVVDSVERKHFTIKSARKLSEQQIGNAIKSTQSRRVGVGQLEGHVGKYTFIEIIAKPRRS